MFKRLKSFLESIAYVGLKPGGVKGQSDGMKWLGPLRGPVDRFLSGGAAPSDPLYLSNRTLWQKARAAAIVAIPCVLLLGGLSLAFINIFHHRTDPALVPALTPAQVASKILPNLNQDIKIETNHDLDVSDVHMEHSPVAKVVGVARNNSDRTIRDADLIFELTSRAGSRQGAVTAHLENIAPRTSVPFQMPVSQTDAAFVIVREVTIR